MFKSVLALAAVVGLSLAVPQPDPDPKATLGHYLFFEKRLSGNHTRSCATCHDPQLAFTDGYRQSVGIYADAVKHNAPSCLNLDSYASLNWDAPETKTHVQQSAVPLFSQTPAELGAIRVPGTLEPLQADSLYIQLFKAAFPKEKAPFTWDNVQTALAAYTQKLVARHSRYDQWLAGNTAALSKEELNGQQLFFSQRLGCANCHGGKDFSSSNDTTAFYNIGLYDPYPTTDNGVAGKGQFRTPSLRNVAVTFPYMHDGSVADLTEVIRIFERGGRVLGKTDGALNPHKSPKINPFSLTDTERHDLIAFLYALTDTSYLANLFFLDPFTKKQQSEHE